MKKYLTLFTMLVFFQSIRAQEVTINDLRTPVSPGFILMDETPASIEKPSTPQGLALKLLSLKQGGALEVAPYWLIPHPQLAFEKLTKNKFPLTQTFSLSLATTSKNDTTNLAVGFRTHILRWRSKVNNEKIDSIGSLIDTELNESELDTAFIKKLKESLLRLIKKPSIEAELAYSYLRKSIGGSYENLERSRYGGWLNIKIRPWDSTPLEALLLSRYLVNPNFKEYASNSKIWDFGGRLLYTSNKVGISVEYVRRYVIHTNSFDRIAGIVEYKINDYLYATATFGKNFSETSNIIALFGLNIGFASKSSI